MGKDNKENAFSSAASRGTPVSAATVVSRRSSPTPIQPEEVDHPVLAAQLPATLGDMSGYYLIPSGKGGGVTGGRYELPLTERVVGRDSEEDEMNSKKLRLDIPNTENVGAVVSPFCCC